MQRFAPAISTTICICLVVTSCFEPARKALLVNRPLFPTPAFLPETADMPRDNALCIVCHVNFAENDSIADHILRGITCAHCHGKSIDHMNDESMMTPPDILYGRSEVEAMCEQCHRQSHKDPQAINAFLQKWGGQKRENGRNVTEDSICTDCHGRHTIPRR